MDKSKLKILCVMIGIFLILLGLNRWLTGQLKSIKKESQAEQKAHATITQQGDRMGIVVIDPKNDPLAPMVKKTEPVKTKSSATVNTEKVYETPSKNPILVQ